ncbi:MAG: DUF4258 domain-containing protein [Chloroflexota bacterium]|nr:DUF4258 domain-containing protein [Chloroflexota bacterium]
MVDDDLQKLAHIRQAFANRNYRYTIHAEQQRIARSILGREIEEAAATADLVEDYPQHRYGPCCLIVGRTATGKALHLVCSLRVTVDIVTVYEPDPLEWEADLKTRRRQS